MTVTSVVIVHTPAFTNEINEVVLKFWGILFSLWSFFQQFYSCPQVRLTTQLMKINRVGNRVNSNKIIFKPA